ncbi:hypothetical protein [Halomicrococcus sp. NG-SE-24]|uniref:hypothetical protein n=1 Tax=Halomicrococcus sp. NG-SE-24 TaxID=3436928 RepID=UPI003D97CE97
MNRLIRAYISLAFALFAIGVFASHYYSSLFLPLTIPTALACCVLLIAAIRTPHYVSVLTAAILIAVLLRVYLFAAPASLIGMDPDAYAVTSQTIVQNGDLSGIRLGFYRLAASYPVFLAATAQIIGHTTTDAMVIMPVLVGVMVPIAAVVLAQIGFQSRQSTAILTAPVAALGAATVKLGYWPVSHSLSTVLIWMALLTIWRASSEHNVRLSALAVGFLVALASVHKAGVVIVGVALTATFVLTLTDKVRGRHATFDLWLVLTVGGVLFVIQALYLTDFLPKLIFSAIGLRGISFSSLPSPTAASVVTIPLSKQLVNLLFVFMSLVLGLIAGLWMLWKQSVGRGGLGAVCAGALLVVVSFVGLPIGVGGFARNMAVIEPLVIGLVVVAAVRIARRTSASHVHGVVGVLLIGMIATQAVASPITPNQPEDVRYYLNSGEVDGKQWILNHAGRGVWMDVYYGDEAIDIPAAAATEKRWYQRPPVHQPYLLHDELTNATLPEKGYETVALRHDVEIYRLGSRKFRLEWRPNRVMSREYNVVYRNGAVSVYDRANNSMIG